MKIKEVNTNYILFDNGSRITFDHEQDCCETNYADFEQLEDLALEYEFENDLIFEVVPENGFRFGSKGTPMFFIPCYSDQNGYLNCKDWMLVEETDFYYRIINKNTGVIKSVDKFRKMRRRK